MFYYLYSHMVTTIIKINNININVTVFGRQFNKYLFKQLFHNLLFVICICVIQTNQNIINMHSSSSTHFVSTIHSISFNGDHSCMAVATNKGFKIFTLNPFELKKDRDFGAPLQIAEMINRSNLVALVGFKQTPFATPEKLAIFDDHTQRIVADMSFKTNIKSVRIRQNKIIVALYNKVFVLDLFSMEIEHILQTFKFQENQLYNIISLSNNLDNLILAAPGTQNGHVLLVYFNRRTQRKIKAHQSILSAVQLTQSGQKLATTSQKGIQIRIFNTKSGQMIQQVRRGNQFATIYSLVFSSNGKWIAVSSDSCNVHIFAIKLTQSQKQEKYENLTEDTSNSLQNPKSKLYFMRGMFPYFDAEYSFSNYKVQDYETDMQMFLSFNNNDEQLVMATNLGDFQRVALSQKGGKCKLLQKRKDVLK